MLYEGFSKNLSFRFEIYWFFKIDLVLIATAENWFYEAYTMYTIVDGIYTNKIMFVFHCHLLILVANEYINYLLLNSNIYRRSAFSKTGIMNDWDDHACRPVSTGVTVVPAV